MNQSPTGKMLSIVLPAHNESENVIPIHAAIVNAAAPLGLGLEIVFVDDGSRDGTADHIDRLSAIDGRVKLVMLSRNFGHQAALMAGLEAATGDAVITMDCDLQHPPALISEMVQAWRQGHEVVQMVRDRTADASRAKRITSRAFYRVINWLSETPITPGAADFQLLDRKALDALMTLGDQRPFLRGMIGWLGFRTVVIHYDAGARLRGASSYTRRRMLSMAVDGITAFSVRPLRMAFYLGCMTAFLSLLYLLFILTQLLLGHTVEGWTSLMAVLLVLGATQLVTLGIVGEYIGRIYDQTRRRPRFVIRKSTADQRPDAGGH